MTLRLFFQKSIVFKANALFLQVILTLLFDWRLYAKGGNLNIKNHSISKLIEIKEKMNLCDIWRIRNPKKKSYTFRQQHFSGLIQ